jgi:hypothetical protein
MLLAAPDMWWYGSIMDVGIDSIIIDIQTGQAGNHSL